MDLESRLAEADRIASPPDWSEVLTHEPHVQISARVSRRGVTIAVALVAAIGSLTWLGALITRGASGPAAASETAPYEFLATTLEARPDGSVAGQAPAGEVLWVIAPDTCRLLAYSVESGEVAGGIDGSACDKGMDLFVGDLGGIVHDGEFFVALAGRVTVDGKEIRVHLGDGRTSSVEPTGGAWLFILGPSNSERGVRPELDDWPVRMELVDPSGAVIEERRLSPPCYECGSEG